MIESSDSSTTSSHPPQPVSSDDEQVNGPTAPSQIPSLSAANNNTTANTGHSRFFAPYRTLGILSNGAGFHLLPHDHSGNAVVSCPVGDRLQIVSTERLQPVLVTQRVPGAGRQHIAATVADASLSINVAVHRRHGHGRKSWSATLFHRTRPLKNVSLGSSSWQLAQLLHLGRIQVDMKHGEKRGTTENGAIVVAVLRRLVASDNDSENDGDSSDDSDDSDTDEPHHPHIQPHTLGEVVILVATRTTLTVQQRIPLNNLYPYAATHPSTYVNKIVIGGTDKTQKQSAMILLNIRSKKIIHSFQCLPPKNAGCVTTLAQSPAVDTLAVGTDYGAVHLVNLRHDRLLFTVKHKSKVQSVSFRTDSSALQYQIAPMAVGTLDGSITIWDLSPSSSAGSTETGDSKSSNRTVLCQMKHVHRGGVAKLEYLPQEPLLLSTGIVSNSIKMHIFDNPDHSGRILRQRCGHAGGPPSVLSYIHPSTGGLMANAADGTDAASSCQLVSAGSKDHTVRLFSSARSVLDKEFGQGLGLEKRAKQLGLSSKEELLLPVVRDMAFSQARSRDWGDMVTIHHQHSIAYVWSTKRGAQSGPVLRQPEWNVSARKPPPPASTHATALSLSPCGNFCVVGTAGGKIYKYNVQSGQPRGSYPSQSEKKGSSSGKNVAGNISRTIRQLEKESELSNRKANATRRELDTVQQTRLDKLRQAKLREATHTDAVTGLAVDAMNKTVVSVGRDAKLILWNFSTHAPHRKSPHILPVPACKMVYVRDSDMAAIALDDHSIFLFDCASLIIVRRLGLKQSPAHHTGPVTGIAFSPDGRSLYSASLDSTIRMWDVPTSTCVDWMAFESAPTSITVSPTGEFLATTHANSLGISLWSDRSLYQTIHTDGKDIDRPYYMDEPMPMSEKWETGAERSGASVENSASLDDTTDQNLSTEPVLAKEKGLITLSGLPAAHWKNLFHLELVKERNKPKEPPKKPPSAPFFLQWRDGEQMAGSQKDKDAVFDETAPKATDEKEWASAWTDENDDESGEQALTEQSKRDLNGSETSKVPQKRPKITRYRSELAAILQRQSPLAAQGFQEVTDYIGKLGPSAIDVELASLCAGMHDLEEGIPLLCKVCDWLLECCKKRDRFEAVNAYLHRFLHLHGATIAGIKDDSLLVDPAATDPSTTELIKVSRAHLLERVALLRQAQQEGDEILRNKMQHSLCLLRHLTRMV